MVGRKGAKEGRERGAGGEARRGGRGRGKQRKKSFIFHPSERFDLQDRSRTWIRHHRRIPWRDFSTASGEVRKRAPPARKAHLQRARVRPLFLFTARGSALREIRGIKSARVSCRMMYASSKVSSSGERRRERGRERTEAEEVFKRGRSGLSEGSAEDAKADRLVS